MKRQTKLSHQHNEESISEQQSAAREFASTEEMLRFDAEQTEVPPDVARRLQKSLGQTKAPKRSWWRNLFGG